MAHPNLQVTLQITHQKKEVIVLLLFFLFLLRHLPIQPVSLQPDPTNQPSPQPLPDAALATLAETPNEANNPKKGKAVKMCQKVVNELMKLRIDLEQEFASLGEGNGETVHEIAELLNTGFGCSYSYQQYYKKWKYLESLARVSLFLYFVCWVCTIAKLTSLSEIF